MEPITHGLSGAIIACTLPRSSRTWWFPLWAALTAMIPDVDVFFVRSPVDYIEFHRGITHSLAGGWVLALGCALVLVMFAHVRLKPHRLGEPPSPRPWSLMGGWSMAYLLILHHIFLDCMNSYGTQVFLPFSDYRVRWNALFIVDPLLLFPLAIGLLWGRARRGVMAGLLIWTILYPLGALGGRLALQDRLAADLEVPAATTTSADALHPEPALYLVPDAFTPFHWKVILSPDEEAWKVAGYTPGRGRPTQWTRFAKPAPDLWLHLGEQDGIFQIYERFAAFPAVDSVIALNGAGEQGETEYTFSDLRFGSTIPFVDAIQTRRSGKEAVFRIQARIAGNDRLEAVRFVTMPGAGGDTGWQPPTPD